MGEIPRSASGTARSIDASRGDSHAPYVSKVTLADPASGETCTVDARIACVPARPDDHQPGMRSSSVDMQELRMLGEVDADAVYVPSTVGGQWRRWNVRARHDAREGS